MEEINIYYLEHNGARHNARQEVRMIYPEHHEKHKRNEKSI